MVHEKGELPVYNSNLELLWIKGDAINNHPGQQVSTTTVLGKVLPKGPDDLAPSRLSGPSMPLSLAHATSVLFELSQEAQVCLLRPPHLPFPLSLFHLPHLDLPVLLIVLLNPLSLTLLASHWYL